MMKNLQKLAIIVLIVLMTMSFAACSTGSNDSDSNSDTGTATDNAPPAETGKIIVGAAASLQGALSELGDMYMTANPGADITFSFASSGTLSKQIEEGAPMDMFVSASSKYINDLKDKDLLVADSCKDLLTNVLILVAPTDSSCSGWEDLPDLNKFSIGDPETVPAGKYAQETLTKLNLWDSLQGDSLVLAKDVKEVMAYVQQGVVEAGVVYYSDFIEAQLEAQANGSELKVKSLADAPSDSHSPIKYGIALTKTESTLAQSFYEFLFTAEAGEIFTKYGFTPFS